MLKNVLEIKEKLYFKKIFLCSIIVFLFPATPGCATQMVSRVTLIQDINTKLIKENCNDNSLYYEGTKNGYHYIYHVCRIYVTKKYQIPIKELKIKNPMPFTEDADKYLGINNIGNEWHSSWKIKGKWVKSNSKGLSIP